jgi:heme a synthase
MHQAVAIAVLTLALVQAERLATRDVAAGPQPLAAPVGQAG